MSKLFFQILLLALTCSVITDSAAQSLNTQLRSNWDDNGLLFSQGLAYNDVWGYVDANQREYAIIGTLEYTIFIDVTDPDNPVEVSRIAGGGACVWKDYKTFGHYAYGVSESNCDAGLEIFDLSGLPNQVVKVYDSDEFFGNAHNLFIDTAQGKLYAVGINTNLAHIVTLDLNQDPSSPTLIKNLYLPDLSLQGGYVHDLYVRNDTAYCSLPFSNVLMIFDFSTLPADPVMLGNISSIGYNHSSALTADGKTLVIAEESENLPVSIADISDMDSPVIASTFQSKLLSETGSTAHNPFIIGNDFVTLSYYDDGLQVYKIDSISKPFLAGYYDTDTITTTYRTKGSWGAYPYLPSGNLLASDIEHGLFVITPNFPLRDCQSNVNISGMYDNHWFIKSKDIISSTALYKDNATVRFDAPSMIELQPAFSISNGSTFEAHINDDCTDKALRKPSRTKK